MSEEFSTLRVTHEFGKLVGWQIIDGRDFSREFASDSMAFVINESAAKYMGLKDPVGEIVKWGDDAEFKIIGVVKDLITQNPYSPVKQTLFLIHYNNWMSLVNIKLNPDLSATDALAKIGAVFNKYDPANPFDFQFADQEYAKKFGNEKRIGNLAAVFATLAVFISCLGLFGLASFVAEQRTKEIGIRKVLGASVLNLWKMLSKDFVVLIVISCAIAIPASFYFMNNWLMQYSYRSTISWQVLALAGLGAILITLLTVSFQAVKAAIANPVNSLRSE
jgi:ABC-type antimicrobial peptide transport system permease subunit